MIQDIGKHRFHNEFRPEMRPEKDSRILFYRGREIFLHCEGEEIAFPTFEEVKKVCPREDASPVFLFTIDDTAYFLYREFGEKENVRSRKERIEPDEHQEAASFVPVGKEEADPAEEGKTASDCWNEEGLERLLPGYAWHKIELLRTAGPKESAFAGVTGMQLYSWYRNRRFCPACGRRTVHDEKERMMRCPACGHTEYPKICPAVIVGVTCADRLLLTKYAGRSFKKYALIAGFAEIGETIEETVEREVMEEVGLKVKNLRYYKSQPWSFTDTLLMGFFAEVEGEDKIVLDTTELSEGRWCTRDEVPEDDGLSLTREMMGAFKHRRM